MGSEPSTDPVGPELAAQVADGLERGGYLAYGHRDYCGMGLRFAAGVYLYGEVHDGDLPAENEPFPWTEGADNERLIFRSRAEFVDWLAAQSDASLSGRELAKEWLRGNQRLTLERLRRFVAGTQGGVGTPTAEKPEAPLSAWTIRYQLTVPEMTGVFLQHRPPRRFLIWWRGVSALMGLAVVVISRIVVDPDEAAFFLLAGTLLFLLAVALLLLAPWRRRRAYTREVRRFPVFTEPKELSFDERGLVFASAHSRARIAWTAFSRLAQDGALVSLYEPGSPLPSVIVPDRAFDEATRQAFRRCSAGVPAGPPSR